MFVKYTLGPNIDSKNLEFPPKLQSRYSQSLQTLGFVKTGSLKNSEFLKVKFMRTEEHKLCRGEVKAVMRKNPSRCQRCHHNS